MATSENALQRLRQTAHHVQGTSPVELNNLSIVHGSSEPALVDFTLGELLDEQCEIQGDKECLVVPWTGARWTYADLQERSKNLAKAMLALGVRGGDRVGILAGNCEEYVAVFFATGYIGCILVVLNSTYTATEAQYALDHSGNIFERENNEILSLTILQDARFYSQKRDMVNTIIPNYFTKLDASHRVARH